MAAEFPTQRVVFCGLCDNATDRETLRCLACGERHEPDADAPYVRNGQRGAARRMDPAEVAMWRADLTVPRFLARCGGCGPGAEHLWVERKTVVCLACSRCTAV